jgi:hypothetical protein
MLKKKMHFILLFASFFALLIFTSGCVEEVSVDEPARPTASIRFISADADAGTTTFSVYGRFEDSTKVVATASVGYASASNYFTIPAGNRKVRVQTSGTVKKDTTLIVILNSYMQQSVFLWSASPTPNVTASYERYTYSDEAYKIDSGKGTKGAVKFINALSDVASVNVSLDSVKGTALFTSIAAKKYGGYTNLAAGKTYVFVVHDGTTEYARVNVPVSGNTRYSVVAFGKSSGVTLKIFTDDK